MDDKDDVNIVSEEIQHDEDGSAVLKDGDKNDSLDEDGSLDEDPGSSRDEPSGSDIESDSDDSDDDVAADDSGDEGTRPSTQAGTAGSRLDGPPPGASGSAIPQLKGASRKKDAGLPSSDRAPAIKKNAASSSAPSTSKNSKDGTTTTGRRIKRCGKCRSCLNPAWKQSCEETRKMREQEEGKAPKSKSTAPKSASATASGGGSGHVSKKAKTKASSAAGTIDVSKDAFEDDLRTILPPSGGVTQTRYADRLLSLMARAKLWSQRIALSEVLGKSSPDVRQIVVTKKGLLVLQKWLVEAIEIKKVSAAKNILFALAALPVTLQALKAPCELGKIVGNLRRAEGFEEVRVDAKNIVAKWRTLVQGGGDGGLSRTGSATLPSDTAGGVGAAAASKPAAHQTAADASKAIPKRTAPTVPSNAPIQSGSAKPVVDSEDIFNAADKKRAVVQTTAPPTAAAAAAAAIPARPSSAQQRPSSATAAPPAAKPPVKPTKARASVSRVSVSPLDAMLSLNQPKPASSFGSSGGGGGSSSFGSGFFVDSLPRTAAKSAKERAMEAAARIPEPEPEPPREKSKKVVWVGDNDLVAVRWFRHTDPPAAAKNDADENAAIVPSAAVDAEEEYQPQFASAAKQEHLSEALVLRQHREQEDQERSQVEERMTEMVERVTWYDPPLIAAALDASLAIGKGQESGEAAAATVRHLSEPPVVYSHGNIPPCPAEPLTQADLGVSQLTALIHRIPLVAANAQQPALHQPFQPQGVAASSAAAPVPSAGFAVDISAALAQLTASGVLAAGGTAPSHAQGAPQQDHQWFKQPPPPQQQQHSQGPSWGDNTSLGLPTAQPPMHQQHQHGAPRPAHPPGMRVMMGLHRSGNQGNQSATANGGYNGGYAFPQGDLQPPSAATAGDAGGASMGNGGGARQNSRSRTPCRFFQSKEGCFRGDKCHFSHVVVDAAQGGKRPLADGAGPPSKWPRTL